MAKGSVSLCAALLLAASFNLSVVAQSEISGTTTTFTPNVTTTLITTTSNSITRAPSTTTTQPKPTTTTTTTASGGLAPAAVTQSSSQPIGIDVVPNNGPAFQFSQPYKVKLQNQIVIPPVGAPAGQGPGSSLGVSAVSPALNTRLDGRCGPNFAGPMGGWASCNPSSTKPCCSATGWCSNTLYCACTGCIDYRPAWRSDYRCGGTFRAPNGKIAQCDPDSTTRHCCGPNLYCGTGTSYCSCGANCRNFRPKYRTDGLCGRSVLMPFTGLPAECNPASTNAFCCSGTRCGATAAHCLCPTCADFRTPSAGWRAYPTMTSTRNLGRGGFKLSINQCQAMCMQTPTCNGFIFNAQACWMVSMTTSAQMTYSSSYTFYHYNLRLNGGWAAWGPCTGPCSSTNGVRTRTCTNPAPINGGATCVGASTMQCTTTACKIDGNWANWSTCSGPCGTFATITRTCTNPPPSGGGAACVGSGTMQCATTLCPGANCLYTVANGVRPKVLLPLYWGASTTVNASNVTVCNSPGWLSASRACNGLLAIVNYNNGPGAITDSRTDYKTCMRMLSDANSIMVGYIYTKQTTYNPATGEWTQIGLRNMTDIKADIDGWYAMYNDIPNFKGIFVDETSGLYHISNNLWGVDHLAHYTAIINYIRTKSSDAIIVLNPGGPTSEKLLTPQPNLPKPADISVAYEREQDYYNPPNGNCTPYLWTASQGTFGPGPFCPIVPVWDGSDTYISLTKAGTIKSAAMVIGTPTLAAAQIVVDLAMKFNIKYVYMTDRSLVSNPWASLSSYWDMFLQYINQ